MKPIAQIAAELPGYDPDAMGVEQVAAVLAQLVEHPVAETEEVGIFDALGRVLAEDVVSPIDVPAHDNSAMDGYAFAGAQLAPGQPLTLRVAGTVMAGHTFAGTVAADECVRIMTGAPMPPGLDTVVPHELTTPAAEPGHITVAADAVRPGSNRRRAGEDLPLGGTALARGEPLTPAALGLLASLGLARATVYRRLRVAVFSTGDEILSLGEAPRPGAVYDSNRYTLFGLLTRLGVQVIDLGAVPDDPARIAATLRSAAQQADAIITSGGVSAGDADHTRSMLHKLADVAFWRVAVQPGRPLAVGRIRPPGVDAGPGALLFGLPGNPVAVMVAFLAFVRPALLRMMGHTRAQPPLLRATTTEALRKRPGRTEYQRGIVATAPDGSLQVRSTGNQGSGVLSSMVRANGLIVLESDRGPVAAGEVVDVMVFEGSM